MNRLLNGVTMVALTLLGLTLFGPPTLAHAAASDDPPLNIDSQATADYAELSGRLAQRAGEGRTAINSSTGKRLLRVYVPACQGNLPTAQRNLGALCDQARQACSFTPDPDDIGYWVYTAPAGPPAPRLSDFTSQGQVVCRGGGRPGETPEPVVTVADFRRLPLPAAGLRVQPPTLRTLVNVRTNLYVESAPIILPTTILGFPIRVRATPRSFRWSYGDGTTRDTSQAGGPYPMLDTAHIYTRPGHPTVALSTAYSGEYSVDGGPWQPIDGTARVSSPTVSLTVVEARTHLVAGP